MLLSNRFVDAGVLGCLDKIKGLGQEEDRVLIHELLGGALKECRPPEGGGGTSRLLYIEQEPSTDSRQQQKIEERSVLGPELKGIMGRSWEHMLVFIMPIQLMALQWLLPTKVRTRRIDN